MDGQADRSGSVTPNWLSLNAQGPADFAHTCRETLIPGREGFDAIVRSRRFIYKGEFLKLWVPILEAETVVTNGRYGKPLPTAALAPCYSILTSATGRPNLFPIVQDFYRDFTLMDYQANSVATPLNARYDWWMSVTPPNVRSQLRNFSEYARNYHQERVAGIPRYIPLDYAWKDQQYGAFRRIKGALQFVAPQKFVPATAPPATTAKRRK